MEVLRSDRARRCRTVTHGVLLVVAALFVSERPGAGSETPAVVERLFAYLDAYEPALSEFVADEEFRQRLLPLEGVNGASLDGRRAITSRRLRSDVGFLRLPGGLAWLAQRSVRTIDGRPVRPDLARLDDALVTAGRAIFTQARVIAEGNAQFNLGHPRSLNVPTLPLELLSRRHADAFVVAVAGDDRVAGRATTRVTFRERPPGAIVAYDSTRFVRANVRAWIAADGALLRAEVEMDPPGWSGSHRVEVTFEHDDRAGLLVPVRLAESFTGRERGDGVATYRNYRRFRTTGRVLPPG